MADLAKLQNQCVMRKAETTVIHLLHQAQEPPEIRWCVGWSAWADAVLPQSVVVTDNMTKNLYSKLVAEMD